MQGTGTKTDPYLIETWDDFFSTEAKKSDTYSTLVNDLDGNDYNNGIFGFGHNTPYNLDGNGHEIRNLYAMNNSGSTTSGIFTPSWTQHNQNISNVKIANVITNGILFNGSNTAAFILNNCKIAAQCNYFARRIDATACTFSLRLSRGIVNQSDDLYCKLLRCTAKVDVITPDAYWLNFNCSQSRIEMKLHALPSSFSSNIEASAYGSVLAIELPNEPFEKYFTINSDKTDPSVMDSTLWGSHSTTGIGGGIILLPTAEMKNADALNEAGFPVVRVS